MNKGTTQEAPRLIIYVIIIIIGFAIIVTILFFIWSSSFGVNTCLALKNKLGLGIFDIFGKFINCYGYQTIA